MNYQAVARDADGNPKADSSLSVTINLSQTPTLSVIQYTEVHSVQTNAFGLFNLVIGQGTPTFQDFQSVSWETGTVYLNVVIGSLDLGTTQLQSVPYALYSGSTQNRRVEVRLE